MVSNLGTFIKIPTSPNCKSKSISNTSFPFSCNAVAKLTDTVLFPVPPFVPKTEIVFPFLVPTNPSSDSSLSSTVAIFSFSISPTMLLYMESSLSSLEITFVIPHSIALVNTLTS